MNLSSRYLIVCALIVVACRPDRPTPTTGPSFQQCQEGCDPPPPPPPPPPPAPPPAPRFKQIVANTGHNGNLELMLLGNTDGLPYLIHQSNATGQWFWNGALPDPGVQLSTIATGRGNNSNVQLIGLGASDGLPYLIHQSNATGDWFWDGDVKVTSNGFRFSTLGNGMGHLNHDPQVDGVNMPAIGGEDGHLYTTWQHQDGDGTWSSWPGHSPSTDKGVWAQQPFSSFLTSIVGFTPVHEMMDPTSCVGGVCPHSVFYLFGLAGGLPSYYSLDVIECGFQGELCFNWAWRNQLPNPSGIPFRALAPGTGNLERPHVIGISDVDGFPYLFFQRANEPWTWYGQLPNPNGIQFTTLATSKDANQNLQVILVGTNGLPYLIYQANSTGQWNWWGPLPNPNGVRFSAVTARQGHCVFAMCDLQVIGLGATDGLPYLIFQNRNDQSWHWYGQVPTQ